MAKATDGQAEGPAEGARRATAKRANVKRSPARAPVKGTAKSPRAALKDGVWAAKGVAIARGNFAEDELAVGKFLTAIMDDLAPQGALQEAQAFNIAMLQWRLFRLARLESEALSGVGRPHRGRLVNEAAERVRRSYAIETADWLVGVLSDDEVDFERVLVLLMGELDVSAEDAGRLFADESEPDQRAFERVTRALLAERFPDNADGALWAIGIAARSEQGESDAIAAREEQAREAVREDLDSVARVHQRINRELQRALRDYELMRSAETG